METDLLQKAKFTYPLFRHEKTGYCTFIYKVDNEKITCVGNNLPENKTLSYNLDGSWVNHAKYGRQFKVQSFQTVVDNSKEGIISYLSSGIIKGIGQKTAERIYEKFGDKSIDILKNDSKRLLEIKGITYKKLDMITHSYKNNQILEDAIILLTPFGITAKTVNKIYNWLQEDTIKVIKENPYKLMDVKGITFETVDSIGKSINISPFNDNRIYAAICSVMRANMICGSVGTTKEELLYGSDSFKGLIRVLSLSNKDAGDLWKKTVGFIKQGKLSYQKILDDNNIIQYLYEPHIKKMEEELAEYIIGHINRKVSAVSKRLLDNLIDKYSGMITLDNTQREAIYNAFNNNISIITGGPGTGKTTITDIISKISKEIEPDMSVVFMAPTGKAARRITESTGEEAATIHSRLGLRVHETDQEYTEESEIIENANIAVDEFSMVDMTLAHKLFENIKRSRIIIIGDINQLQSVGAGSVLRDLIDSKMIPVTFLKYVHRQGENSGICENADNMQNNITTLKNTSDFHCEYIDCRQINYMEKLEDLIVNQYITDVKKYGMKHVVCLCPYKEYAAGVYSVNRKIQNILNPLNNRIEFKGRNNLTFRVNDPVMKLKNDNTSLNGDVGIVKHIGIMDEKMSVVVLYENGNSETYTSENIEEITLAYAMTIHKSQGSEYDSVVMCLTPFHKKMLKRSVLYTGITRAKKNVTLFSTEDAITRAIQNNSIEERHTMLSYYLRKHKKEIYNQLQLNFA